MKTELVEATVSVVLPEFELVKLELGNGDTLSIGKRTQGVDWRALKVGQRLLCLVEGEHATRVLRAELIPSTAPKA